MALVLDGTNGVSGVDGTASNPAIEGTDSNTGIFYPAADTVAIGTGGTEALRVDSSQRLGVGGTPTYKLTVFGVTSDATPVLNLRGYTTGADGTRTASIRFSSSNDNNWAKAQYEAYSHLFNANGSLAMTLDASGNLGIGVTSMTQAVEIKRGSSVAAFIEIAGNNNTPGTSGGVFGQNNDNGVYLWNRSNNFISLGTNNTERARITSGGVMLLGTTSTVVASNTIDGLGIDGRALTATWGLGINSTSATGTQYFVVFGRNSSACGTISSTTTNSTTYATSSDYRLKENIQPMIGALAKVAALKPCTYTWKEDGSAGEGFIAHELAEVCPQAVVNEKDAINEDGSIKPQGVDTSFLVATLTAAIQELNAKVEAQAAEIAALKGNA